MAEETSSSDSSAAKENPADFMPPPPPANFKALKGAMNRTLKKLDGVVLRTTLDLEACRKIASDTTAKKEEEQKDIVLSAPSESFKKISPISDYKKAASCPAQWESMSGTEAFRICRQCGLHVYNFNGIDVADAKELIVKREGKENQNFYRRKDGKFLTSNCPVGVKQSLMTAGLITAGIVLAITAITVAVLAPPPRPAVTATPVNSQPAEPETIAPQTVHQAIGGMKTTSVLPSTNNGPSNLLRRGSIMLGPAPQPLAEPELPTATQTPMQQPPSSIPAADLNSYPKLVAPPVVGSPGVAMPSNGTGYTKQTQVDLPADPKIDNSQLSPTETAQPAGNPYVKEYR